jgi:hypothetical protein
MGEQILSVEFLVLSSGRNPNSKLKIYNSKLAAAGVVQW